MSEKQKLLQALDGLTLLLASASGRRRALLRDMGYRFDVFAPDVDERIDPQKPPAENAIALAEKKALAARERCRADIIVASDTLTSIDGEIIGKPVDDADARRILRKSSAAGTSVVTAIYVLDARDGRVLCEADEAIVHMRELSDDEIAAYVDSGQAQGKAGAYAIREKNDPFVERVEGEIDTVMGFSACLFERLLGRLLFEDGGRR